MDWISILRSEDVRTNDSVVIEFEGFVLTVSRDRNSRLYVQARNAPNSWEILESDHLVKIRRTSLTSPHDQQEDPESFNQDHSSKAQSMMQAQNMRREQSKTLEFQKQRIQRDKSTQQAWKNHVDRIRHSTAGYLEESDHIEPEDLVNMEEDELRRAIQFAKNSILHQLENARQQRSYIQDQISRGSMNRQRLQDDRDYVASKRDILQIRIHDLELQIKEAEETLEPYEERVEVLERDVRSRHQASEILLREFHSERKKMNAIKGKAHELKSNMVVLKKQLDTAKEKVNAAEKKIAYLDEKDEARQHRLVAINDSIVSIKNYLDAEHSDELIADALPPSVQKLFQIISDANQRLKELQVNRSLFTDIQKAENFDGNTEAESDQVHDYDGPQGSDNDEYLLRDWRSLPSVWIRRRRFAMNASSPRWKKRIQSETDAWQIDSGQGAKKHVVNQEAKKQNLATQSKEELPSSANVAITTKFLEDHPWLSGQYRISCYEHMKDQCVQVLGWEQEREERLKRQGAQEKPLREIWESRGIPSNSEADIRKLRSIRAKSSYPSLEEDRDELCRRMHGKWDELEELFRMMDLSGDGLVDVNEFKNACATFELHWSDFQMTRLFHHMSRSSPHLSFSHLLEMLAPPRMTAETRNLLQTKVPFLQQESEEAMKEVMRTMKPKHWGKGDVIFHVAQLESVVYVLYSGKVKVVEVNDTNFKIIGPGNVFGEEAVRNAVHVPCALCILTPQQISCARSCYLKDRSKVIPSQEAVRYFPSGQWSKVVDENTEYKTVQEKIRHISTNIDMKFARWIHHLHNELPCNIDLGRVMKLREEVCCLSKPALPSFEVVAAQLRELLIRLLLLSSRSAEKQRADLGEVGEESLLIFGVDLHPLAEMDVFDLTIVSGASREERRGEKGSGKE
eukprot:763954-Hanusia_phi.AAC.1